MANFRETSENLDRALKPRPKSHQPQSGARIQPAAQVVGGAREAVEPQRGESIIPLHMPDRLLDAQLRESNADAFAPAVLMTINQQASPQAIFVVMQTTQYETGPMFWRVYVWRVTVVDSIHIPAETRIPAKQI